MEPATFDNVDLNKLNDEIELENKFNSDIKSVKKGKQTTLSDFIK